ncbi:GNAT family N-acetyltransferase [Actinoplanes teichomyceticus]|uniref:RimJ/RimL family protein N-acetyltransferase n=1 Tax=Actinoplanes teichomyceticus TaxID=1867 RepID=A0A561VMP7_ACTTI|nr:GNAT family N-acetyltransferase [Actinoplanes teichomyceticus]TWG12896.1 RimJ/RimL family protein N-acetyltransferase [Actinoplanes teichomyceticus]GIF13648.1 GNAT family acetyltransferase [Actinoplanes teichomyceticus]
MGQPTLRTERLLLVPLADRHFELEVELDADAEVLKYIWGRARTRDEVVSSHAERMALAAKVDGLGYWMAFGSHGGRPGSSGPDTEAEGEFVGLMMLPPAHGEHLPDDPTVAELGYRLHRRYWRQGLAAEASRMLLRHAFDTVGQSRVIAQAMAVNIASRGVMERIGMRYVRTFHQFWDYPLPGSQAGEVEYEMTRAMWEARRGTW